jgi:hypothetical protein
LICLPKIGAKTNGVRINKIKPSGKNAQNAIQHTAIQMKNPAQFFSSYFGFGARTFSRRSTIISRSYSSEVLRFALILPHIGH